MQKCQRDLLPLVAQSIREAAGQFDLGQIPTSAGEYSVRHRDTDKQDYIAQAERHITIVQERIARQKRIIDELAQTGPETDCAVSVLHALESCLHDIHPPDP
jgi:hypothetical protein